MAPGDVSGSQWVDDWLCALCALAWLPAGWTGLEALAAVHAALLLTWEVQERRRLLPCNKSQNRRLDADSRRSLQS
jgi:hypothetical protein